AGIPQTLSQSGPTFSHVDEQPSLEVRNFQIAPDGRALAVVAEDPKTTEEKREEAAKADAKWIGHDQHGTHLYLLDLATHRAKLVPVPPGVRDITWSKEGSRLLAISES